MLVEWHKNIHILFCIQRCTYPPVSLELEMGIGRTLLFLSMGECFQYCLLSQKEGAMHRWAFSRLVVAKCSLESFSSSVTSGLLLLNKQENMFIVLLLSPFLVLMWYVNQVFC